MFVIIQVCLLPGIHMVRRWRLSSGLKNVSWWKSVNVLDNQADISLCPYSASLSPITISPLTCFLIYLEKLLFFFQIKHLPVFEVRVDLLSSAPLKSFAHLPFGQTYLELWNTLVSAFFVLDRSMFCFCMRGIPSRWDPKHHIFSALHKESFIIFIFCLALPQEYSN